jgi:hypothetical protein
VFGIDFSTVPGISRIGAFILNVTVTEPTADGYLSVFPSPPPPPLASNLNFVAGQTVPNLVVVPLGANGRIDFYNPYGMTHLVVDLFGVFTSANYTEAADVGAATANQAHITVDSSRVDACQAIDCQALLDPRRHDEDR